MLNLFQRSQGALAIALVLLFLPSAAYAQAAITGVVKDASGAVLPGATVEAASPVLIEKARSVVTDDAGQYRIVDLRPGTYSVTVSLTGFTTVKREGIELSGNFVATVNADMKVGALEETITVTGESPIVDVQSTRSQQIIDKEVLAAIPSSRNVVGIQAIIPGMNTNGDSGGINGTMQGGAAAIHGGRTNDSRIYADGINMGWAGSKRRRRQHAAGGGLAGSGHDDFRRPRRSRDERTGVQCRTARRCEQLHRPVQLQRLERLAARQQLHAGAQGRRPAGAVRADQGVRRQRHVRRPDRTRQAMVLWRLPSGRRRRTVPGMFENKNAGNPNVWTVDFDRSKQAFNNSLERQATIRLTWQATPRNKFNFHWSEQYNDANYGPGGGAGVPPTTPEATSRVLYIPSRQPHATWQSPISGRLLAEAGWGMYQARYRFGMRNDGTHNPAMIQRLEQTGELGCVDRGDCIPGLLSRMPRAPGQGGFTHSLIGNLASLRASMSYVTGSHNMKFGYQGGFGNPSQTYQNFTQVVQVRTSNGVPNQLTQTISVGPDTKYIRNLIPTNLYAQGPVDHRSADRAGRLAVRLADFELSGSRYWRRRLALCAGRDLLSEPIDSGLQVEGPHPADGSGLRPVREREDRSQVQPRQVHGSHHGEQQRSGHEPADPHRDEHHARVDRH
jgi:hypothetical protein